MDNALKRVVRKSRNKFLASITELLNRLETGLEHLEAKMDAIHGEQQSSINELRSKIINSGTIRISETEILTKIFSGIKFYLDPKDISVTPHLSLDYIWEENVTYAWLKTIKPGDMILDIGANFGYFGALAAQYAGRKSKVIFFEPNPHLISYIEKTLSMNWLREQSIVENLAVSDKEGSAKLNILKDYMGSSSLHSTKEIDEYMHGKMIVKTEETVSVQAVTVDAYCQKNNIKHLDLVKMDIEGYEDKAYKGMADIIKSSPNITLFVEFTKDSYENPKQFYEQMLKDFKYIYTIDEFGNIIKPKTSDYKSVIGEADDWVMLIFSKRNNLTKD